MSRALVLVFAALLTGLVTLSPPAVAQPKVSPAAAMVNSAEGEPLGTATVAAHEGSVLYLVTAASVVAGDACIVLVLGGECRAADASEPVAGAAGLVRLTIDGGEDERNWSHTEPGSVSNAAWFVGRSSLADWRRPVDPAAIAAMTPNGFIIQHANLTAYDVGAPVLDAVGSLVGVIAKVDPSAAAARVVSLSALSAQLPAREVAQDETPPTSGLPATVAREVFSTSLFYGNTILLMASEMQTMWPADFQTEVVYRAFELSGYESGGGVASLRQAVQLDGLTAASQGITISPGKLLPGGSYASCVMHTPPSAPGRTVIGITFWQLPSGGYGGTPGNQVGPVLKGWVSDDQSEPCLDHLREHEAAWGPTFYDGPAHSEGREPGPASGPEALLASLPAAAPTPAASNWSTEVISDESNANAAIATTAAVRDDDGAMQVACAMDERRRTVSLSGERVSRELAAVADAPVLLVFHEGNGIRHRETAVRDAAGNGWAFEAEGDDVLRNVFAGATTVTVRTGWGERLGTYSLRGLSAALTELAAACSGAGSLDGEVSADAVAQARETVLLTFAEEATTFCAREYDAAASLSSRAVEDNAGATSPQLILRYGGINCEGVERAAMKPGGFCGLTMDGMKCQVKRYVFLDDTFVEVSSELE